MRVATTLLGRAETHRPTRLMDMQCDCWPLPVEFQDHRQMDQSADKVNISLVPVARLRRMGQSSDKLNLSHSNTETCVSLTATSDVMFCS